MTDQSPYGPDFPSGLISGELGGFQLSDPDDGLGDKPVETTVYDTDLFSIWGPRWGWHRKESSSRAHLLQEDGSSGVVTISVAGSAGTSGAATSQTFPYLEDDLYGSVAPLYVMADSRGASLSSSLGQTSHRDTVSGLPKPAPDLPDADGTVHANSVKTDAAAIITYYGHASGSWTSGSSWLMNIVSGDGAAGGTFSPPVDPICQNDGDYTFNSSSSDHVYLHLKDAIDGADATANYYVAFHDPYEDWWRNSNATVAYPRPYGEHPEDWTFIKAVDNDSPAELKETLESDIELKKTMEGTIGAEASAPGVADAFKLHEDIIVGHESTYKWTQGTEFTAPAWTRLEYYSAMSYQTRARTCSVWGTSGYTQDANWAGVYSSGAKSDALVQTVSYSP